MPATLRILLACGVYFATLNGTGTPIFVHRVQTYINITFKDPEEQRNVFNAAALEFVILLRSGLDPYADLFDDIPGSTPAWGVTIDPQFTEVAWKLALKLSGWEPDEEDEIDGCSSQYDSDHDSDRNSLNDAQEPAESSLKEVDKNFDIPGAWVEEEEETELPLVRKFWSTPGDFVGEYNGHLWPVDWYDFRS